MFEWNANGRLLQIRDVESEADFHAIEEIQKEAWQFSDLDVVPAATLIASQHAGGIVLGAFDGHHMIGFAYAFPALEDGHVSMHSHMLAVIPECRNVQAGFYLKLVQRQKALDKGLDEITWTFDPLQSLNAHLNFSKLGVVSQRYLVDFYGNASSSPLHQGFGTDRLWVRWLLNSDRVTQIAEHSAPLPGRVISSEQAAEIINGALVICEDSRPRLKEFGDRLARENCSIEIPRDIGALKESDPGIGKQWREATRAAFLAALDRGFSVEDFVQIE